VSVHVDCGVGHAPTHCHAGFEWMPSTCRTWPFAGDVVECSAPCTTHSFMGIYLGLDTLGIGEVMMGLRCGALGVLSRDISRCGAL
jgi:hypothetical protein